MRKNILIILMLTLITPFLFSCNRESESNIYGTDVAKILLAQERLNSDVINGTSNLFKNGEEAFNNIVKQTRRFSRRDTKRPNEAYTEVDGDTYKWYNDIEYSNFNSFFESYAVNIENSAKNGAELINHVKKNIRVVDVWVSFDHLEYLLKVDKVSETIYTRDNSGRIEICKRTTDENGNDVYELLTVDNETTVRMKYIPGLLYEFAIGLSQSQGYEHYLIADKSKGYWNILSTSGAHTTVHPDGLVFESVSFEALMMKEEGYYKFDYTLDNQGWSTGTIDNITLISSDGKTDLVTIGSGNATLFNTGIKGLDHIEITASKEYVGDFDPNSNKVLYVYEQDNADSNGNPYKIYSTSGSKSAIAVLENGMQINENDSFVSDKVRIGRIDVSYVAGCDAYGVIPLRIDARDLKETFDILVSFLDETNLSFKRDLDTVLKSSEFALNDVKNFSEFFQFNGYNVNTLENAKLGIALELEKINNLKKLYDEVKDIKVISYHNQEEMDENIHFADLEVTNAGTIENNGFQISVKDISVKVDDTVLFVENEKYKLVFALLKDDGSILPLNTNESNEVTFVKSDSFEISENTSLDIPLLEKGNYVLVAYIATALEGIRITKASSIIGNFNEAILNQDGIKLTLSTNSDKYLIINSTYDYNIYLESNEEFTYEELVHYMGQSAYNHGMIDETVVEVFDGSEWHVLESTSEITTGQYRMKYIVTLENVNNQEGYVLLTIA